MSDFFGPSKLGSKPVEFDASKFIRKCLAWEMLMGHDFKPRNASETNFAGNDRTGILNRRSKAGFEPSTHWWAAKAAPLSFTQFIHQFRKR